MNTARRLGAIATVMAFLFAPGHAPAQPDAETPPSDAPEETPDVPLAAPEAAPEETAPEDEALPEDPLYEDEEEGLGISTDTSETETEADPEEDEGPTLGLRTQVTPLDIFRAGGTVSILGARDLERIPLDDPNAVLPRVPGVYVRTEDGFGLRPNIGMRGVNPERSGRITLMEDGVLFGPAPYAAPAAYYFPLMMRMTGVEVAKGPAAILYGPSTVGGAVNLRSRPIPERAGGEAELFYGMFRSRRAHLHYGASTRNAGFVVELADVGTDGFKDIDFAPGPTGFSRGEYVLRGFVRNDPNARVHHRLELRTGFSFERSYETYLGLSRADFRADPYRRYVATERDRMQWHRYEIGLTHRVQVGTEIEIETALYRHDLQRTWRRFEGFANGPNAFEVLLAPGAPTNQHFYDVLTGEADSTPGAGTRSDDAIIVVANNRTFISQGMQSTFRFERPRDDTRATGHHLELGVRLHYDSIVRRHVQSGFAMQSRALVPDGFDDVVETHNHGDAIAFAAFAAYSLEWRALRVSPGMRAEVIRTELFDYARSASQVNHTAVLLPGLGLSYAMTPWLATFVGVHRGFSPVGPGQTSEVRAESSIAYEGGVRALDEESGLAAELSGFYNDYRNLLLACSGAGGCPTSSLDTQFNAGSANVGGVEASFSHTFTLPRSLTMPVRASYTYTLARFRHVAGTAIGTPGYEEAVDGANLPYVPSHQGQIQLGVEHARFDVTMLLGYVGKMRENASTQDDESLFTDDYVMLDLAGHYALTDRVRIVLRGENLLNQQALASRRPFGARPTKPLTVIAGFQITL